MSTLKTLAECKPTEFMAQTNRIKKAAEKWLKDTNIEGIRKVRPEGLEKVSDDMPLDDRLAALERNKKLLVKQAKVNISNMLDAVMDKYPEETLELLALCCFVEPDHVDDYPMSEYLDAFNRLINDKAVIGFFTSLVALARMSIS